MVYAICVNLHLRVCVFERTETKQKQCEAAGLVVLCDLISSRKVIRRKTMHQKKEVTDGVCSSAADFNQRAGRGGEI